MLKECHDPVMLPVDEVRINPVMVNNVGLSKSIYMKEQLEEFARFQDSQGTRKAYLAETAEMANIGRNKKGEWGLALGSVAQGSLIDLVGGKFLSPVQGGGPYGVLFVPPPTGVGRAPASHYCFPKSSNNSAVQRMWNMGDDGFLGDSISAGGLPLQLDQCSNGGRGEKGEADDGDRGSPGARGKGVEGAEHGGLTEEIYSWWPSGQGKNGSSNPTLGFGAEAEDGASLRLEKSTKV